MAILVAVKLCTCMYTCKLKEGTVHTGVLLGLCHTRYPVLYICKFVLCVHKMIHTFRATASLSSSSEKLTMYIHESDCGQYDQTSPLCRQVLVPAQPALVVKLLLVQVKNRAANITTPHTVSGTQAA